MVTIRKRDALKKLRQIVGTKHIKIYFPYHQYHIDNKQPYCFCLGTVSKDCTKDFTVYDFASDYKLTSKEIILTINE